MTGAAYPVSALTPASVPVLFILVLYPAKVHMLRVTDGRCFDCGAVEMECEDYPEHCDYSTGNCVCNDYNTLAPSTQAL